MIKIAWHLLSFRLPLILSPSQEQRTGKFLMNSSSWMGSQLWVANCLPMMDGRVCILLVLFLLIQRSLWLPWLIGKRRRKKGLPSSWDILPYYMKVFFSYLQIFNPFDFVGRRENTRSQFELLEEQTCTTFTSFCVEDRGTCLKRPYKYLMLSSGSLRLGSIIAVLKFFSWILLTNLLSGALTNLGNILIAVMLQYPDPFSLLLLVTEETSARGLSVGEVTTRAYAQHKWGFHWI